MIKRASLLLDCTSLLLLFSIKRNNLHALAYRSEFIVQRKKNYVQVLICTVPFITVVIGIVCVFHRLRQGRRVREKNFRIF